MISRRAVSFLALVLCLLCFTATLPTSFANEVSTTEETTDGTTHGSGSAAHGESTDGEHGEGEHVEHNEDGYHVVFCIASCLLFGTAAQHFLGHTTLPYTCILLIGGIFVGWLGRKSEDIDDYLEFGIIDPHLLLYSFLPLLIFESAYTLNWHIFKKSIGTICLYAGPGVLISTFLTGCIWRFIFDYDYSWSMSLLFGCILSATDPVAVVALLRDLGADEKLSTTIEGESLLNDGTAIVLFGVLFDFVEDEEDGLDVDVNILEILGAFAYVGGLAPFVGYGFGRFSTFWLSFVWDDPIVEISITLSIVYMTFYVAEGFIGCSGVLAVVCLGLYLNAVGKTNISSKVHHFLHEFYSYMGFFCNTLVFMLCGIVAGRRIEFSWTDLYNLGILYVGIHFVRATSLLLMWPFLKKTGYGIEWRSALVIIYGGLRGAVGLALCFIVYIETITKDNNFLFFVGGIVILTITVNATTIRFLLAALGMSEQSEEKRQMIAAALENVRQGADHTVEDLQDDPMLFDADWNLVKRYWYYPDVEPVQKELAENVNFSEIEGRAHARFTKAMKESFWSQNHSATLSGDAVIVLCELADASMDNCRLLAAEDVVKAMETSPSVISRAEKFKDVPYLARMTQDKLFHQINLAFHLGFGYLRAIVHVRATVSMDAHQFSIINDPAIAEKVLEMCTQNSEEIDKALLLMRAKHPEVCAAVGTAYAAGQLLHHEQEVVDHMVHSGTLEQDEANKILDEIQKCVKNLHYRPPVVLPASAKTVLAEIPWVKHALSAAEIDELFQLGSLQNFAKDQQILEPSTEPDGVRVVLQGILQWSRDDLKLGLIGGGFTFGEYSYLCEAQNQGCFLTAVTDTLTLHIPAAAIQSISKKNPELKPEMWLYAGSHAAQLVLKPTWPLHQDLKSYIDSGRLQLSFQNVTARSPVKVKNLAIVLQGRVHERDSTGHWQWLRAPCILHGPCTFTTVPDRPPVVFFLDHLYGEHAAHAEHGPNIHNNEHSHVESSGNDDDDDAKYHEPSVDSHDHDPDAVDMSTVQFDLLGLEQHIPLFELRDVNTPEGQNGAQSHFSSKLLTPRSSRVAAYPAE